MVESAYQPKETRFGNSVFGSSELNYLKFKQITAELYNARYKQYIILAMIRVLHNFFKVIKNYIFVSSDSFEPFEFVVFPSLDFDELAP